MELELEKDDQFLTNAHWVKGVPALKGLEKIDASASESEPAERLGISYMSNTKNK